MCLPNPAMNSDRFTVSPRGDSATRLAFNLSSLEVEAFEPDKLPPDLAKMPAVKPGSK
jgi:hypothetical protein